jgi:hypothetical protein
VIGGKFKSISGVNRSHIARLNTDGSLDLSFDPGTGADVYWISSLAIQNDGKILAGGDFSAINGVPRDYIARLNGDLIKLGLSSRTNSGEFRATVLAQPGNYTIQFSTNMVDWDTLQSISSTVTNFDVRDSAPGDQRFYRAIRTPP